MIDNKQQTAVEWLVKELNQKIDFIPLDKWDMIRDIIQQAKERDKEQKLNMFNCGRQYQLTGEGTFKQVYQEIYGGGEQC